MDGGCYCGAVRYQSAGEPMMRAQCHCRECQYITGGGPNFFMMVGADGFVYTKGAPSRFTRSDIERPVTREFCGTCGTHIATRVPGRPMLVLKVGTLDDPSHFGGPELAIFTIDRQPFHIVGEGIPQFDRMPG